MDSTKKENVLKAHLAMLTANLMFGLNTPIAKTVMAVEHITSYSLTMLRMVGGALLFWVTSLFLPREPVTRRDLFLLFWASLFGITLNQNFYLLGLSKTSPIDASIVATTVPIITMILAAVALREPITWLKAMGVALGVGGALILILNNTAISREEGNMAGNLICLAGCVAFAIYLTGFKQLISRYSSVTLMKWMFFYAALLSIPYCLGDVLRVEFSHFTWDITARLGFILICSTYLCYLLIPLGQKYLRPTIVSMYNYVQPIVASLLAVALGLDTFGITKGFAALLVFVGVYLVNRSKSRQQIEAEYARRQFEAHH